MSDGLEYSSFLVCCPCDFLRLFESRLFRLSVELSAEVGFERRALASFSHCGCLEFPDEFLTLGGCLLFCGAWPLLGFLIAASKGNNLCGPQWLARLGFAPIMWTLLVVVVIWLVWPVLLVVLLFGYFLNRTFSSFLDFLYIHLPYYMPPCVLIGVLFVSCGFVSVMMAGSFFLMTVFFLLSVSDVLVWGD